MGEVPSRHPATQAGRVGTSASAHRHVQAYRLIARLFDQAFRIPGTRWRFGLDPILGLIPVAGDLAGALAGFYGIWVASKLGAPASIQLRMAANLIVDDVIGSVPLIGDLVDFGLKAHVRNVELLARWEQAPDRVARRSSGLLIGIALLLLAALAGIVILSAWLVVTVIRMVLH